ncbi:MAG: 30S ribosomal protein S12 methylthiotransferase RimO, partial [Planctomycetota bacterium]
FSELLEFVKWAKFDALGCFPFYPEPGTVAAELADQLPDSVKQERVDALMQTQQELVFAKMDRQIGREMNVLVDDAFEGEGIGRYYGQAPHIDSICKIQNCQAAVGDFIQAKIIGRDDYDFVAVPI